MTDTENFSCRKIRENYKFAGKNYNGTCYGGNFHSELTTSLLISRQNTRFVKHDGQKYRTQLVHYHHHKHPSLSHCWTPLSYCAIWLGPAPIRSRFDPQYNHFES